MFVFPQQDHFLAVLRGRRVNGTQQFAAAGDEIVDVVLQFQPIKALDPVLERAQLDGGSPRRAR
jgi:hypothetical protein